ncbi:hypothetical protein PSHT_08397 [Puccinia striiformis]|uniref:Uncharacterized protein n=1 Tax=Puccinia striiformis TaxID=27350 RepID=A0A2S4VPT7_9BASI|nr:hypothetical protein PSHT_08397 [Puccinia striiformis]
MELQPTKRELERPVFSKNSQHTQLALSSSAFNPTSDNHSGSKEPCAKSFDSPSKSHEFFTSSTKSQPIRLRVAKAGRIRPVPYGSKKFHFRQVAENVTSHRRHPTRPKVARAHLILKRVGKSHGHNKSPKFIAAEAPQQRSKVMTRFNFKHIRSISKRSPAVFLDSKLTNWSIVASRFSASWPPWNAFCAYQQSSRCRRSTLKPIVNLADRCDHSTGFTFGPVRNLTGAAQSAPVLGDLLKVLPISALLKGNPIDNVKSTLSGVFVAIPVLGGPLGGVAGSLPISLVDMRAVTPANAQRTVTNVSDSKSDPQDDDEPSREPPMFLDRTTKFSTHNDKKSDDSKESPSSPDKR